ncbi:glycosyltransferase family 4 protein [Oceanicola sp. 22II-s10i]|uniref:glycosyltransferase family 4 protein n=1 Tax=Oceanicola sp. 22II-s10i TaxID=1317116 RepID=UPI000B526BAF|nr:glycosyltransferase family 4 protein [Oceanicola sp. 22II-s10i]
MIANPHIALFYDIPNWAFHNVARNVARIGARNTRYTLLGRDDWFGKPGVASSVARNADVLVFLWRFDLLAFLDTLDHAARRHMTGSDRPGIVTIVYDHIFQSPAELSEMGNPFHYSDAVGAASSRLKRIYDRAAHLPDVDAVLPDGVDLTEFPAVEDTSARCGPIRIGWVGNSAWGSTVGRDLKGKATIFDPAVETLKAAGAAIDIRVADRARAFVPKAEMPAFYADLDVLVCSSAMEGTPNPVLEAMATGVAVVSTDVGIVPDVLGPLQKRFILPERSAHALARALNTLVDAPEVLAELKAENLSRRNDLSWGHRAPVWDALFEQARKDRLASAGQKRTALIQERYSRKGTATERARRWIARNRLAYRLYSISLERFPALIRFSKYLLARSAR